MAVNEVSLSHLVSRNAGLPLPPGKNTPLPTIAPTESTIDRDPPPVTRGVDCRDSSPISRKPSPPYVRNSNGEFPPSRYWGGEMALDIDIHKYLYIYIFTSEFISGAPRSYATFGPAVLLALFGSADGGNRFGEEGAPRRATPRGRKTRRPARNFPKEKRTPLLPPRAQRGANQRGRPREKTPRRGWAKKVSSRAGLSGTRVCSSPQKMINMATEKPPLSAFLREYGVALSPGLVLDCVILLPSVSP